MSEIRANGRNASNTYTVPDEHSFSEDIILEQLQILDGLFPSTKVHRSVLDGKRNSTGEKRNSSDDDKSSSAAKRQKVEIDANPPSCSTDKNKIAESASTTKQQPLSRLELKESIKRAYEATKPKNSELQSNDVQPIPSSTSDSSTSSKVTRDIHQFISVVNPKGQMQRKLDRAAPYNFFLTTITDSKPTHCEPLSITFQGNSDNLI